MFFFLLDFASQYYFCVWSMSLVTCATKSRVKIRFGDDNYYPVLECFGDCVFIYKYIKIILFLFFKIYSYISTLK